MGLGPRDRDSPLLSRGTFPVGSGHELQWEQVAEGENLGM